MVLGFDLASKSLVPGTSMQDDALFPQLDGELRIDEGSRTRAADDFGHLVHRLPSGVIYPRSVEDIAAAVNFARKNGIKVAPRGQGKCAFGQTQVEDGLVIRMSTLKNAPVVSRDTVQVRPGMMWRDLLAVTLKHGLRPPVMAGTMYLSVGGTLALGGIDQCSFQHGAQVDNVVQLEVVTGEGKFETCSDTQLPDLFNAILSGQGQCGLIVNATLPLVPAQTHACVFTLLYRNQQALLDDMRLLMADGRFDRMLGSAMASPTGRWVYYLQASRNFTHPDLPDRDELLAGLRHLRGFEAMSTPPYFEMLGLGKVPGLKTWTGGPVKYPRPWFSVVLPDSTMDEFLSDFLSNLTPSAVEPDFWISLYPIDTGLISRPLFRMPKEPRAFLVVIFSSHRDPETVWETVERNRRSYEQARELGGVLAPMGAIPLSRDDWQQHYGPVWDQFCAAKQRFDPDNVLTPGPGIF